MAHLLASPLRALWAGYERQLERRPVLTQATTSALLWGTGDAIAQRLEHWEATRQPQAPHKQQQQQPPASLARPPRPASAEPPAAGDVPLVYDLQRMVLTGLFGATFVGPVGHFWYIALDKWCRRAVPGGGPAFIATKVLFDTAAMGPFYVAAFFAWGCALMDGGGLDGFRRKMAVDFVPTLAAEVTFWPLVQSANFALVPLKHQLLVVNSMTILDAIFMSWARNQDDWFGKARAWASAQGQRDKNGSS